MKSPVSKQNKGMDYANNDVNRGKVLFEVASNKEFDNILAGGPQIFKGSAEPLQESKGIHDKSKNFKKYSEMFRRQKEIVDQNEK